MFHRTIIMQIRHASKPLGYALANGLVFKKVRDALGLDRARVVLSGAAPLSREVSEYFMSLDIPIMEVSCPSISVKHRLTSTDWPGLRHERVVWTAHDQQPPKRVSRLLCRQNGARLSNEDRQPGQRRQRRGIDCLKFLKLFEMFQ